MNLIRSPEQMQTPWRDLLTAAVAAVLLPSGVGLAFLGLFRLLQDSIPSEIALALWGGGMMLMLSPILSAGGMFLALPISSLLIRLGWFGWGPAALTGLGIGAALGVVTDFPLAALSGMTIMLILRAILGLLRPMAAPQDGA